MKIAIQHWQEKGIHTKNKVLSRWVSYHGITLGALSMSGHTLRRERFLPLLEDFPVIQPPYCYRCPYQAEPTTCRFPCAKELENVIGKIGADQIAAFIAEPVIGAAGGAITPPEGYYQVIKEICERYQILFIADEVMTGFGRTGKMLACEQWGIEPDIVALGKGMGAGYAPIAATLVSDHVMEPIQSGSKSVMSGHTLSANPQSCAVSLSVIEYLQNNKIIEQVELKAFYLFHHLEQLQSEFQFIGDIRGKGLLLGIEFVRCMDAKEPYPREYQITQTEIRLAANNGLLLYPSSAGLDGINGDAIIIAPPLIISKDEIDELIQLLRRTFEDLAHELLERKGSE